MGEKEIRIYKEMIMQINRQSLRRDMVAFLGDPNLTDDRLNRMLAEYIARFENNYAPKPEDRFLMLIEGFKRKGTVHSPIPLEDLLEMVRETKRQVYLGEK